MATLPQLVEDDVRQLDTVLRELLEKSEAATALIIDKGGFLITHRGEAEAFDLTSVAALASGAFLANATIANLVQEDNFNSVYQQGAKYSILAMNVDEHCLLLIIFKAAIGVGVVKYYAAVTAPRIAAQLQVAQQRNPGAGIDLSVLNLADTSGVFKRKS